MLFLNTKGGLETCDYCTMSNILEEILSTSVTSHLKIVGLFQCITVIS